MLNNTEKNTVISTLTSTLGVYSTLRGNELAFYCPFCHHHKQKLQVNTETQKWHCWTCNSGGKKLTSLLRKLDVDRKTISIILDKIRNVNLIEKINISNPLNKYDAFTEILKNKSTTRLC